ncbi:MAG: hypothetical protein P8Y95_02110 [Gammaproteobacteria bacterium]|jgi:hypothetical protein
MVCRSAKHLTFVLGSGLALLGCALLHPSDAAESTDTDLAMSREEIAREVRTLLSDAEDAMADERYLPPASPNAYDLFRAVLRLQPHNDKAFRGLERIVEAHLERAIHAFEMRRMGEVYANLARARRVDPHHPSIATVERRLELLSVSKRDVYSLEREAVAKRKNTMRLQLQRIGFEAKTRDAVCVITARSDAEGRWIYQQLADSPGEKRVRAEIEIGTPPSIELRYLPPQPEL